MQESVSVDEKHASSGESSVPRDEFTVSRRQVLAGGSLLLATSVAGCMGGQRDVGGNAADLPSPVSQTAQRDKAAVVHIQSIVSGRAIWPSYEYVSRASAGTEGGIVGTWQTPGETVTFTADGWFSGNNANAGAFQGTYSVQGNTLVLRYTAPSVATVQVAFQITSSGSGRVLQLSTADGAVYQYQSVGGGGGGPEADDIVSQIDQLELVRETGPGARLEEATVRAGASGTGFVVTPDGYVVTNAHVVLAGENLEQLLLQQLVTQSYQQFMEELSDYYTIPPEDREKIGQILVTKTLNYFLQEGQIADVSKDHFVLNGIGNPGDDLQVRAWPGVVKKEGTVVEKIAGQPTWGRDIAIVKVERDNLPTVDLGDSDRVEVGETVFIIGYPGFGLEQFFQPDSTLEPTVTQGVVSARRTLRTGIRAIQTDAAINHGNSGGPVYNSDGQAIGIATFGAGPEVGIESIKFAMPINLAIEFLHEINVEPHAGELDEVYDAALDAYWRGNCKKAVRLFEEALVLYPGHPYAREYINDCKRSGE